MIVIVGGGIFAQNTADLVITLRIKHSIPPSAITDLTAITGNNPGEIILRWTSPQTADDSTKISAYYIRWSTISVADLSGDTTQWWNNASGIDLYGREDNPGLLVETTVKNLIPAVTYYFAIKSEDDCGNLSPIDEKTQNNNQAYAYAKEIQFEIQPPEGAIKVTHSGIDVILTNEILENKIRLKIDTKIETTFYIKINFDPLNIPIKTDRRKIIEADNKLSSEFYRTIYYLELVGYILRQSSYTFMSEDEIKEIVKEINLTFYYKDENNDGKLDNIWPEVDESTLKIYRLDENQNQWYISSTQQYLDIENNKVIIKLESFSVYSLIGENIKYTIYDVEVFPNPCKPGSGNIYDSNYIVFRKIPEDSTVKIFTISGELVVKFKYPDEKNPNNNIYRWYMKDKNGKDVASGIYIYVISDKNGKLKRGKMGIIR